MMNEEKINIYVRPVAVRLLLPPRAPRAGDGVVLELMREARRETRGISSKYFATDGQNIHTLISSPSGDEANAGLFISFTLSAPDCARRRAGYLGATSLSPDSLGFDVSLPSLSPS